jgi:hypothetical protein
MFYSNFCYRIIATIIWRYDIQFLGLVCINKVFCFTTINLISLNIGHYIRVWEFTRYLQCLNILVNIFEANPPLLVPSCRVEINSGLHNKETEFEDVHCRVLNQWQTLVSMEIISSSKNNANFLDQVSERHLCKIWGFHGGDYEEWCLLGCYAVWLL